MNLDKLVARLFPGRHRELGRLAGKPLGRFRTLDYGSTALQYRMQAGFPGDVTRTHTMNIEPTLIDGSAPPQDYGIPVLIDSTTQGIRPFAAGDQSSSAVKPYGFLVRPYPLQQNTATPQLNAAVPPQGGYAGVLRQGYMTVILGDGTLTGAVKDGPVYVWTAASTGHHVQGRVEASNSAGNTTQLDSVHFNGVQDANGLVEIQFASFGA